MTTVEISYLCDVCGHPIADGAGAVLVRYSDLVEWRRSEPNTSSEPLSFTVFTGPILAPWRVQHDTCADVEDAYDVGVEKIRTFQAALDMTSQLMQKRWLPSTDWAVFIGEVARGDGSRIVHAKTGDAA